MRPPTKAIGDCPLAADEVGQAATTREDDLALGAARPRKLSTRLHRPPLDHTRASVVAPPSRGEKAEAASRPPLSVSLFPLRPCSGQRGRIRLGPVTAEMGRRRVQCMDGVRGTRDAGGHQDARRGRGERSRRERARRRGCLAGGRGGSKTTLRLDCGGYRAL